MHTLLRSFCSLALGALMLGGCATHLGSRSLPSVRANYTQSIAESADQQMLFNLVRLHHGRLPVFLQISSVVTQYGLSHNVGVSGTYNAVGQGGFVPPGGAGVRGGVSVEERPTITYTPLQGEQFVRRLATPLSSQAIAQLVQAGWPWDAVLACCVQQVNGQFAPAQARRGQHTDFQRLGGLLRNLQETHAAAIRPNGEGRLELVFAVPGTEQGKRDAAEVRRLLGLDPERYRYTLALPPEGKPDGSTVTLHGRSMMAALHHLSQGVEGPGRSAPSPDALLRVHSADKAPKDAYAVVDYGEHAYFIEADDHTSQDMFILLSYLFSLMATPGGSSPVVTIGAGG